MSNQHLIHPKYRPDIDGLRAFAVIAVVSFHAFPFSLIEGVFICVDIFFVISGFLISTILYESLEKKRFSFTEFYSRRIRRIFPSYLIVLIAVMIFGWFLLLPDEYAQLGKHVAASAGFASNFILWNEVGYFDKEAMLKPLLHFWSLAIEEQFYIVWAPLLWFFYSKKINLLTITVIFTCISFAINLVITIDNPVLAYYSPLTRFWEFQVGSLLAYFTLYHKTVLSKYCHRFGNYFSFAGFLIITIGIFSFTIQSPYPGWRVLIPTLGAALIMLAGSQAFINRYFLSNRIMVWFGLISFPLYLWHWPLLSFAQILESGTPPATLRIILVIISVGLAYASFRWVEAPMRSNHFSTLKVTALIGLMAIIGFIGYNVYSRDGLSFRAAWTKDANDFFEIPRPGFVPQNPVDPIDYFQWQCSFDNFDSLLDPQSPQYSLATIPSHCYQRQTGFQNTVFLWGDSHALMLYSGLKKNMPLQWNFQQIAQSACSPSIAALPNQTRACIAGNQFALNEIAIVKPDVVIIAKRDTWDNNSSNLIANKLKSLGVKKVLFIGKSPEWEADLPKIVLRKMRFHDPTKRTWDKVKMDAYSADKLLQKSFINSESAQFVSLNDFFCNSEGCLIFLGDDLKNGITSYDSNHLTPMASNVLAKELLIPLMIKN